MVSGEAISESATITVTDRQVACVVAEETVILQLHEVVYYGLNSVGTCIWRTVQTPCKVAQVVDAVVAEFEVERDRCVSDVRELLAEMQRHELVTVS